MQDPLLLTGGQQDGDIRHWHTLRIDYLAGEEPAFVKRYIFRILKRGAVVGNNRPCCNHP